MILPTEHPTVAKKAPHKFFAQSPPAEEEEEAVPLTPPSTSTAPAYLKKGPRIGKDGRRRFKFSGNASP